MGGGMTKRMHSTSDPESGQQSREGKPDGFHYSEHRTVDSKRNVIVNVHIEPANLNDVTPLPEILDEIQVRLENCRSTWTGCRIPQYLDRPSAGKERNPGCHWLPEAHPQDTDLRQISLQIRLLL